MADTPDNPLSFTATDGTTTPKPNRRPITSDAASQIQSGLPAVSASQNASPFHSKSVPGLSPAVRRSTARGISLRAGNSRQGETAGGIEPNETQAAPIGRRTADPDRWKNLPHGGVMHATTRSPIQLPSSSFGHKPVALSNRTISEELASPSAPPSFDAALGSPSNSEPRTTSSASTESAKTIRGTVPSTPSHAAMPTPSYPFPRVSSFDTTRWPTPVHQPFTTLSPLDASMMGKDRTCDVRPPIQRSEKSVMGFEPPGNDTRSIRDDPHYLTPNLYELVLKINTQLGLDPWWTTIVDIMRDWYKAERLTLALPADPTDTVNVPWGQKASFNMSGIKNRGYPTQSSERSEGSGSVTSKESASRKGVKPESPRMRLHSQRMSRPSIISRHSFAGYEMSNFAESAAVPRDLSTPRRPDIRRTASYVPGIRADIQTEQPPTVINTRIQEYQYHEPRSASTTEDPSSEEDPCSIIYSTLRSLDAEEAPLLDSSGANRVLERNKLVVLVRDVVQTPGVVASPADHFNLQGRRDTWNAATRKRPSNLTNISHIQDTDYEEYEQIPCSPWSQSPAPSPAAIREDPDINPFFSSGTLDEDSFSPTAITVDYSKYKDQPLEAIGIHASSKTIVHIPLLHPAQNIPIAILSLLSPTVPYPPNLAESLKYLGPHLATSFQASFQNTIVHEQIAGILHRRKLSRRSTGALHSVGLNMLDLLDSASSTASVSDYSGQSKHSPTASAAVTPNLDFSLRAGTPGTTGGIEAGDNYFEVKQRMNISRTRSGGPVSQSQLAYISGLADTPLFKQDAAASRKEQRLRQLQDPSAIKDSDRQHSLLHSYGADFGSSFQSLPAPAAAKAAASTTSHNRSVSSGDSYNMPPPSEKLLRTIIDSLPVQIFTAAPGTGALTWVNSKFLVYRGQTPKQVLDDPWEAIHPEDLEDYISAWKLSLQTGSQFSRRVRLRRFDSEPRWFFSRAVPLKNTQSQIVHWIGTYMDCHDETIHQANAARQEETAKNELKYRALANSSPQIVFVVARSSGLTFCNSQWVTYSGQTEEEALGIGFLEAVHPDDLGKCKLPVFDERGTINVPTTVPLRPKRTRSSVASEDSVDSSVTITSLQASPTGQKQLSNLASNGILSVSRDAAGKPSYSTEVRLRMKSGSYRWHLIRLTVAESSPQPENNEEIWYGTATEIEAHKRLEQELKETMDAKTRFLSNMSHEIRTPLNGIHGMASFLIDSALTTEQMDQVNVIRASTEGLKSLINDILDFSKVEAGMIELTMDWLHVRSVIEEVNDLTASLALEKGIELNYYIEETLPNQVKGDKFRLRQVLLNVIGNAIKFTREGEVLVTCKVSQDEDGRGYGNGSKGITLQFDVLDTGRGFNEEEAELLFKRFSQIDASSTRQHGGSGLGLVISKNLVELHGGSMTATSVPGKGSMFTFTIYCPDVYQSRAGTPSVNEKPMPLPPSSVLTQDFSASPAPYTPSEHRTGGTSSLRSSASSDPSVRTAPSSIRSEGSSASSYGPAAAEVGALPVNQHHKAGFGDYLKHISGPHPMLYSVLVVCPLKWSRTAAVKHMETVLPREIPHHVAAVKSISECMRLIGGEEPVVFTHIVVVLGESSGIMDLVDQAKSSDVVVVCNAQQKREISMSNPSYDFDQLARTRHLRFIFKPLKPSKLAAIFDPEKLQEISTDQNQSSAQQIKDRQTKVFDETARILGNKGFRTLLVEDNKINQMVIQKYLRRISITVETVEDGIQCTDLVFSKPSGHFSIILCDLSMPRRDGYETCKMLREWEQKNHMKRTPCVALSANVMGDVYAKCVESGFDSYISKPVVFSELSKVMVDYLLPKRQVSR